MRSNLKFEPVIGLEIHAQLLTDSKIFCRCSTRFGSQPNTQVCPICLGMPGALPVLNRKAVEFAIKMGLATHCQIATHSTFARKNYFYPDLPKGYQISQYESPLCHDGYLKIKTNGQTKQIGISRLHLEEDAGKSIHAEAWVGKDETLIDLNRCGIPLIEIVTAPDIRSPKEAFLFLTQIRQILQYLEICNGNMEEGSLRCDANISVRPPGSVELGVKTELKNLNSFHGVEKALEYEVKRQIDLLMKNGKVEPATLLWDEKNNTTITMRTKEIAPDYRYFPEPDLVPLQISSVCIDEIKRTMPELPQPRRNRVIKQYKLPEYDATILTDTKAIADFFETVAVNTTDAKLASNWVMGEILRIRNEQKEFPMTPQNLANLLNLISNKMISGKIAKTVFKEMLSTQKSAQEIVMEQGFIQLTDEAEITKIIETVIQENPTTVEKYLSGKTKIFSYLIGQIMKATNGKANPQLVNRILKEKLKAIRTIT